MIPLIIVLLSIPQFPGNSFHCQINGLDHSQEQTLFLHTNDTLNITSDSAGYWYHFQPIYKEYNNLQAKDQYVDAIKYIPTILTEEKVTSFQWIGYAPGTNLISFSTKTLPNDTIQVIEPLHKVSASTFQVTVKESNTYLGLLTELLGLPFTLPPKVIPQWGHQTDLRMGTDCAELAIYGMRRLGLNIPYGGPRGILKFLDEKTCIENGHIIHFGFQVSVVYKDRGRIGQLDQEDLLIHAFEDRVKIEKLGDTDLFKAPYKIYEWKDRDLLLSLLK